MQQDVSYEYRGERDMPALGVEPFQVRSLPDGRPWMLFHRVGQDYLLRFPNLADFEISADGRRIAAWGTPGADALTVEHLYMNQARPMALARQGKLVLHGSAVETHDGCVAFLGASGQGKSTLAASFASAGLRFLSDDGLEIDVQGSDIRAMPSHPSLRLWNDSHGAISPHATPAHDASPSTQKVRLVAGPALPHCTVPRPLRAVFSLGEAPRDSVCITRISPSLAVLELIKNSFLLDIAENEQVATHFKDISRLANAVPHFALDYPRRFDALPDVRAAIRSQIDELATA